MRSGINFFLAQAGFTKITVLDELSRIAASVVSENLNAGNYSIPFDAAKLSNGIYTYVLESGAKKITGKMSIVK